MWVLKSDWTSVWRNLAAEDLLLDAVAVHGGAVLFYRNRPCLVFGKNQNPWQECRVERLRAAGIPVARRFSGGGTVYHDGGNLNYALILPREHYDRDRCFDWVLNALRRCGIPAERMGSTSIGAKDLKLSGTAFAYRRSAVLHHGTLLIQSDLPRLRAALRPPEARLSGHAIRSDPAPVANARALAPSVTASHIMTVMLETLPHAVPRPGRVEPVGMDVLDVDPLNARARTYRSVAWRFGGIPDFVADLDIAPARRILITVRKDRIDRAAVETPESPPLILPLRGRRFRPFRLSQHLHALVRKAGKQTLAHAWEAAAKKLQTAWA